MVTLMYRFNLLSESLYRSVYEICYGRSYNAYES